MRAGSIAFAVGFVLLGAACKQQEKPAPATVEVRAATGNTFELVPHLGENAQFKYCLVFTRSETGVIRQLTMTHENKSVHCQDNTPIANVRFRTPVDEGVVKVHVFLSDQKLNATSIANQLYERKGDPSFHPMDLRLPGNVMVFTAEFKPGAEAPPMVGGEIGQGGEIKDGGESAPPAQATDAGTAAAADAGAK